VPELPEVEALCRFLSARATGDTVVRVELVAFSTLKTFDPPLDSLRGRKVAGCERRGKHLCLALDGGLDPERLWMVIHLARGGWIQWRDELTPARAKPGRGPLALRVGLSGGSGFDITEMGTEKRLAVWVVPSLDDVETIKSLGPDPLSPGFDKRALAAALSGRTGSLKSVLTDQSVLAGVGNAYSDEALHAARLSPFKPAARLSDEELERLYHALIGVLQDASARSAGLPAAGLKGEKKSGMRVHGRTGESCPVCGDTVREVSFATKSLQYCPTCQTGGKPLADRRLSKLLK
jgi:formamidopyrimidine-DNA glycosylase